MAAINKMANDYTNINSLTLSKGTILNTGQIATSGTIDGLFTGTSTIVTVPTGRTYFVTGFVFNLISVSGIGATLQASVGTNAATYDNILSSTTFTGWNATTQLFYKTVGNGTIHKAVAGEMIVCNITTQFTGTTALFEVLVLGIIL